jgi:hypothetical protein
MVVLIVVYHNRLQTAQPVERVPHTPTKGNQQHKITNETKTTYRTHPRLHTGHIQRQRSQRGIVLQSVTQHLRSFIVQFIVYRYTPRDPNTSSAKPFQSATLTARQSQQSHTIHGSIDRASPQSTLNSPISGALRYTHFNKRNLETQRNQTLLTSQVQRQRSQRGVVLQSITQRLRSFGVYSILYRHTRVEST